MMGQRRTSLFLHAATIALGAVAVDVALIEHASAQSLSPPPVRRTVDDRGVDLVSGSLIVAMPAVSIGQPGLGGLAYVRSWDSAAQDWRDNITGTIHLDTGPTPDEYIVTVFGASEKFTDVSGVLTPKEVSGSTLTFNSGTQKYTYTTADGAVAVFDKALASTQPTQANEGRITTFTEPSGEVTTFTYTTLSGSGFLAHRVQSVTNNLGYQLKLEYASNAADSTGLAVVKATALNNAVDYCDPTTNGCSGLTQSWPTLTFATSGSTLTVTDSLSRVTTFTFTSGALTGIKRPTSGGADNWTITYSSGKVATMNNGSAMWTYSITDDVDTRDSLTTDPNGNTRYISIDLATGQIVLDRDALNHAFLYTYNSTTRLLSRITDTTDGNYTDFTYDARGNLTGTTSVPISGSGLSNITTSASYPSTCSNVVTCNKPTSTTDERGNVTDYTYDSTHGGLLTVTSPAPSGGSIRPETRISYSSLSAWYKNSGGSIVQAGAAVYRPTSISACATTSSCASGSDETKTTLTYTAGSSGAASNVLPASSSSGAGNGSLTATTAVTFDSTGNLLTVDGPLSGTNDTTRYRYDAARQTIGVVGPDPDGGGSLKHRALRYTYNADGQATSIEQGTVNSQSDGDWSAFSSLQTQSVTYDSIGRTTKQSFVAGGTTYAVTQYSYDSADRLDCVAQRMNPSVFGSLPGACSLGTQGSNGPDRIQRYYYNADDRVTSVRSGYGTALEQTTVETEYRSVVTVPSSVRDRPFSVVDANGNRTTFEYDGFNRIKKVRYPSPTTAGTSSTTDYEEFTYDAASNVTVERRRDASTVTNTYDALNRQTLIDLSTGDDVTFAYDNFDRLTSAAFSGHTLSWAYDQLSRNTSATGPRGTVSYQYDLAGQRTRMTWPDSFYVDYDIDLGGAVTAIRENGASSGAGVLGTYAYDDLGRRTTLTRGNGVVTTWSYDAASRLTSLAHNLSGSAQDQTFGFTHNAAFQSIQRTSSNSSYDMTPPSNATTGYTNNGLNQHTVVGGVNFTYDSRGNLTSDGVKSYGYDILNRLTSASSATLAYDPSGRLYETSLSGTTTRFAYDGVDLISEFNGSNTLQRRFVHGPGLDEPLTWYEGTGTSDRRWLVADQLGSVIAVTDGSGAATTINTYDEYGIPGSGNAGRFQYTGQTWLPEAGVYYYKARVYAPTLGRFLQTDPIGFDGGMNLYAYVGGDPVNWVDPLGLLEDFQRPNCPGGDSLTCDGPRSPGSPGIFDVNGGSDEVVVTAQRPVEVREPRQLGPRAGTCTLTCAVLGGPQYYQIGPGGPHAHYDYDLSRDVGLPGAVVAATGGALSAAAPAGQMLPGAAATQISIANISARRAGVPNLRIAMSSRNFFRNLASAGYSRSTTNGVTHYTRPGSIVRYTYRPSKSAGMAVDVYVGNAKTVKYSFGP